MEEHEVPTHVQAEDRVLLWFTFPQIVALTAVAALAYAKATSLEQIRTPTQATIATVFTITTRHRRACPKGMPVTGPHICRYSSGWMTNSM